MGDWGEIYTTLEVKNSKKSPLLDAQFDKKLLFGGVSQPPTKCEIVGQIEPKQLRFPLKNKYAY